MTQKPVYIGVLGANGRMGRAVIAMTEEFFSGRAAVGAEVSRGDSIKGLENCDVVIDFSSPDAVVELIRSWTKQGLKRWPKLVIGSTGWTEKQKKNLDLAAKKSSVLEAANFSIGVLVMNRMLKDYGAFLAQCGFDVHLSETHHTKKKDRPSGTALRLKKTLQETQAYSDPHVHSLRFGNIVGEHTVDFFGVDEILKIEHRAYDRAIFAKGSIEAALWLAQRKPTKKDRGKVLGLDLFLEERLS